MEEYVRVRRMHLEEGMSVREIRRRTGLNRRTIAKMIVQGAPEEYKRSKIHRPKLGPFMPVIDRILETDARAPVKQRHTAQRILERLTEEHGYRGGYTQVRLYVKQALVRLKERFVPLELGAGVAQADWGEAWVQEGGDRRKIQLFVMTLPWSNARFVAAFPRATQEFFFEGHLKAFEFFGGVPRRIIYDNLKSAVTKVFKGRRRDLNAAFETFSGHYLFEASFCNVRRGNEKGHVEGGVKWAQRSLMTPIPAWTDWARFNESLERQCGKALERPARPEGCNTAQKLEEERAHLHPLPTLAPHIGRPRPAQVNSLCLVHFDSNAYSVPSGFAHHEVMVRADVARVEIYHRTERIAAHCRSHKRGQTLYEPWHYLALVEQRPRTLDDGAPMKRLELPECFGVLRRRMESGQEYSRGTRAYIRVLRLLERHPVEEVGRAVERALALGAPEEEAVKNLLLCPPEATPSPLDLAGRGHLFVRLPPPDPGQYRQLMEGGALA
jgi:transposase